MRGHGPRESRSDRGACVVPWLARDLGGDLDHWHFDDGGHEHANPPLIKFYKIPFKANLLKGIPHLVDQSDSRSNIWVRKVRVVPL